MLSNYDEKAAYERRRSIRHSKHDSVSSTSSSRSSSSFDDEKYDDATAPSYAHAFYNTLDDKPLPPLPGSQERRVRFMVDKPLPALPRDTNTRPRASSQDGEYARWSKRFEMTDSEYDAFAREKEMA